VRTRRTLTVKIPPGVDNGTQIKLAGEGEVGPGAGPAGNLYIEIVEEPHEIFQRRGDDLHCTVTMPMTAAALGTKIPLQTLDGQVELDIRPGSQSGQSITMRGRGIQHLRGTARGDLVVHIEVQTPKALDAEQEGLLRKLAQLRGEERPSGTFAPGQQGLFSRLKDALNNR
jgi:molecular chaperone DnaJ